MKTSLRLLGLMLGMGGLFVFLSVGHEGLASPVEQGDSHYFPETNHTVSGKFWQYWQSNGGLAQQGYPISDEFTEVSDLDGKPYTVQYFERATFELHPENAGTPYEVLLSQLGTFRLHEKYINGVVGAQSSNEVGSAVGENAFELVGQTIQQGNDFIGYGYLTHISGLSDDQLFTSADNRSEATARFTYHATAQLTARSVISSVFVLNSVGTLDIYFNATPHGDFFNEASFKDGTQISTSTIRWHNILSVQAPNRGIATGTADMTQKTSSAFTLGDQQYQLGRPGLLTRLTTTGTGVRSEPTAPNAVIFGAGEDIVTGQGTP
jgi:hypothetical protein